MRAIRFGDGLRATIWVRVHAVESATQERAWQLFKRTRDQDFSFTDCTSFALMESLRLEQAFTFDRGFLRYGLEMVPGEQPQGSWHTSWEMSLAW